MSIKQIAVFIENKKGSLAEITRLIADNDINMRALSIADTQDFGILRIITDDPDGVRDILKNEGYAVTATSVLAVSINDAPGSMAKILDVLNNADIAVEYTYAFRSNEPDKAAMIFRVDNNDKATKALTESGISVMTQKELFDK